MLQIAMNEVTPYNKFKEYLEEGNMICVDEKKLNDAREAIKVKIRSRFEQLRNAIFGVEFIKPNVITKQIVIDALIASGVPDEFFCQHRGINPIYYNDKTRAKVLREGYGCEIMYLYESYNQLNRMDSSIGKVIHRQVNAPRTVSNTGDTLIEVLYSVYPIKNLRFTTKDENTIGFYGELRSSFTAPEGYYILSCDFPQIDGRAALNLYLKNDRLEDLVDKIDDTYLLFKEYARHISHEHDVAKLEGVLERDYYTDSGKLEARVERFNPDVIPFRSKGARDIYKVTALKTAYYARHSMIPAEAATMRDLVLMYESNERYKRILQMTKLLFNNGITIEVTSRWGHKRPIVEHDLRSTISSVFNAPIQATSSEVIIFYVTRFLDYFREKGHGPEDVRICLNRHDEPIFYIKKEVYHQHIHFIASMRQVLVQGWAPINLEMFVGHSYKVNLPEASEALERIPLQKDKAKLEASKYKGTPEPYTLVEPDIYYISLRKFSDGTMRVAVTWNTGEYPKDLIIQPNYEDRRPFGIKILSFKSSDTTVTHDTIEQVVNNFSNSVDNENPFIVFNPYGFHKDVLLNKRTAYFRNIGNSRGKLLAESALAAIASREEPETITPGDKALIQYLEENQWRFSM